MGRAAVSSPRRDTAESVAALPHAARRGEDTTPYQPLLAELSFGKRSIG